MPPPARAFATTVLRLVAAAAVVGLAVSWAGHGDFLRTALFQFTRNDVDSPKLNGAVYVCAYLGIVLSIAVGLCHRPVVRALTIAITLAAAGLQLGFAAVNGTGYAHHEASLLLTESRFIGSALRFFLPRFAPAVGATLLAGAAVTWLVLRLGPRLRSWLWLGVPLASVLMSYQVLDHTHGRVYQFPPPVREGLLTAFAWQHRLPVYAEREAPYFHPSVAALADHIVLVVDESISGHWLQVNGAPVETTPWLMRRPEGVFNFGIASSVANLSASSNILLQTGLRPADLPDREYRALRGPNVFAYMSAAGYHTAFIDAQNYSDTPPNFMTGFDLRRIDTVVQLRESDAGLAEYAFDFAALPRIARLIDAYPRTFTYLIKTGAHFPYVDKAPPDAQPFSTPAERAPDDTRHAYWNTIRWTTDHFLEQLTGELARTGKSVLVVYTSDHGQWLPSEQTMDRKIAPHGTLLNPPAEQAAVPLILLGIGPGVRAMLAERFNPALVDAANAYQIFPTLLQAAGYAATDTHVRYAPSLFDQDPPASPRTFVSGNVFASNAGAYVLNRSMGNECYVNRFDLAAVRLPRP